MLHAQQEEQRRQHEAENEAHRRELMAVQARDALKSQMLARFFSSLNIPGVTVPPELLSILQTAETPATPETEAPVSI